MGLRDLYKHGIQGPYGFDMRTHDDGLNNPDHDDSPAHPDHVPATMKIFRTHGTPWTVVLGRTGEIVDSRNTWSVEHLIDVIDGALTGSSRRAEADGTPFPLSQTAPTTED